MSNVKVNLTPSLIPATIEDYHIIQNMAPFYMYDISRHCGFNSLDWAWPERGAYEAGDYKIYFTEHNRYPFLVRVEGQLAGFVLIDKVGINKNSDWNMGQFFIIAKFQGAGVAAQVFKQLLAKFPGQWEISAIPENTPAVKFWRKVIDNYTNRNYTEETKLIDYDGVDYNRTIFTFDNFINHN